MKSLWSESRNGGLAQEMRIAVDTNVLVRSIAKDDVRQSKAAIDAMSKAGAVIVSTQALCELAWVLSRQYKTWFRCDVDTEISVIGGTVET